MLSSAWNFVKRHKKKFIFTGVVIAGTVAIGKYAQKRFSEFQEREATECIAFARRQHHFDSNQRTCNMTVLSMVPTLREQLLQQLDTEVLIEQLKNKPINKKEIWQEMKIISFTRCMVAGYSMAMITMVLRVQLNIIGGYLFLDTIQNKNGMSQDIVVATADVQQQYLANIHYLLGKGLEDLIREVRDAVTIALQGVPLNQQISILQVQTFFHRIRKQLEYRQDNGYHDARASSLCRFMLDPETEQLGAQASSMSKEEVTLSKLMVETKDILESSDFHSVLTMCLDTAFTRLVDKVSEFFQPDISEGATDFVNPIDVNIPMAKLIPVMNGLIHSLCMNAPNPFVQELLLKDQVKDFAANVYEAFSQPESTPQ